MVPMSSIYVPSQHLLALFIELDKNEGEIYTVKK